MTNRLLIKNTTILTMDPADRVIEHGDIVVEDNRIVSVGATGETPPEHTFDTVIDGSRRIVIPGLINAHTHTYATLFKGGYEKMPLDLWLLYMRAPTRALSAEQLELSSLISAAEMLRSGTTTCLDHFSGNPLIEFAGMPGEVRAFEQAGIRAAVAFVLSDMNWDDTLPLDEQALAQAAEAARTVTERETAQSLAACEQFLEQYQGRSERVRCLIGPSAVHRCTDSLLRGCQELADRYGIGVHLHCGESKSHALQSRLRWGKSLVGRLDSLGILDHRVSLAHCTWIDDEEIEILARTGATAVHNPAGNLKLGDGVARVRKMHETGVNVAIATDGPCSSDNFNLWEALRIGSLLQTTNQIDYREWLSARQLLRLVTVNAARAVGLEDQLGSIEPGKLADLVLLTRDSYHLAAHNDWFVQLVYCEDGRSVDTVIVDGRIVVEGGKLLTVDEGELFREVGRQRDALRDVVAREHARTAPLEEPLHQMWLRLANERLEGVEPSVTFR